MYLTAVESVLDVDQPAVETVVPADGHQLFHRLVHGLLVQQQLVADVVAGSASGDEGAWRGGETGAVTV